MDEELKKHLRALRLKGATDDEMATYVHEWDAKQAPQAPVQKPGLPQAAPADQGTPGAVQHPFHAKDVARSVIGQGAMMGFGDEAEAAVRHPFTKESYTQLRDKIRNQNDTYRKDHPVASIAGEVAGGLAPMLLTGGTAAAAEAPMAARGAWSLAKTGFKAGAKMGAAEGFGRAEGSAGSQLAQTGAGAAGGAILGGLLAPAGRGLGMVKEHVLGSKGAAAERLGGDFAKAHDAVFTPSTKPISEAATLMNAAPELTEMARSGTKSSAKARAIYKAMTDRQQAGEGARAKTAIGSAVGESPVNVPAARMAHEAERAALPPQYESALAGNANGVSDPSVLKAVSNLRGLIGADDIVSVAEARGFQPTDMLKPPANPTLAAATGQGGQELPTARYLEELKQRAVTASEKPGLPNDKRLALLENADAIRKHLHSSIPELAQADAAHALTKGKDAALDLGQKMPGMHPDEIGAQLPMSADPSLARQSTVGKYHEMIDSRTTGAGNVPEAVFGNDLAKQRVEQIVNDPQKMAEFDKWLAGERAMQEGQGELGNLRTAPDAPREQVDRMGLGQLARGNPAAMTAGILAKIFNQGGKKIESQAAEQAAPILSKLLSDPTALKEFMAAIREMQSIQSKRAGKYAFTTALGTGAGASAASALTARNDR